MAQEVQALAVKPGGTCSVPGSHTVEGNKWLPPQLSYDLHLLHSTYMDPDPYSSMF